MNQRYPDFIWHNGEVKPWQEATVHVMAHGLHYGSSVFEGIRSYQTPDGAKIFRLTDHLRRLYASAKIYDMAIPYTLDELTRASRDVIAANQLSKAYLRPIAYRGLGGFGLSAETPVDVSVATWEMGPYLGAGVLEAGIDACVSSWQRFAPNTLPAGAKAGGHILRPGTEAGAPVKVLKLLEAIHVLSDADFGPGFNAVGCGVGTSPAFYLKPCPEHHHLFVLAPFAAAGAE